MLSKKEKEMIRVINMLSKKEKEMIRVIKRNVVERIESKDTPSAQAPVRCLMQNIGIDLFDNSGVFLPDDRQQG